MDGSFFSIQQYGPSGPGQNLLHGTGGSAAGGEIPSPDLSTRRIFQSLPWCIPNKWAETGTRPATAARPIACNYAKSGVRVASVDQFSQRLLDFGEFGVVNALARVKDDIPTRLQFVTVQAERLSQTPLDAVADVGFSDRPGNRESQPGTRRGVAAAPLQAEGHEQRTGNAKALVINLTILGSAQNARLRRIAQTTYGSARSERFFRR